MNDEPPRIVISAFYAALFCVRESPAGGTLRTLTVDRREHAESSAGETPGKVWWFRGFEDLCAWLLLRIRDLSREGSEVYVADLDIYDLDIYSALVSSDGRTEGPLREYRDETLGQMLEW